MKKFRKRRSVSNLVMFTIAELAWLIVFFMIVINLDLNRAKETLEARNEETESMLEKLDSEFSDLETKLAKSKNDLETSKENHNRSISEFQSDLYVAKSEIENLKNYIAEIETNSEGNEKINWEKILKEIQFNDLFENVANFKESIIPDFSKPMEFFFRLGEKANLRSELEAKNSIEQDLLKKVNELESKLTKSNNAENQDFQIRQEIIGLGNNSLRRVVFIFDRSDSMGSNDGRWEIAQKEIKIWLNYLPIKNIVLIDFNDEVNVYPEGEAGSMIRLRDENNNLLSENLIALLSKIESKKIGGRTNTYEALKKAYEYQNVDLVLLFTDGVPATRYSWRNKLVQNIYELIENQKVRIPIYSVALGDYGEKEIQFLKKIAELTNGSFIGK